MHRRATVLRNCTSGSTFDSMVCNLTSLAPKLFLMAFTQDAPLTSTEMSCRTRLLPLHASIYHQTTGVLSMTLRTSSWQTSCIAKPRCQLQVSTSLWSYGDSLRGSMTLLPPTILAANFMRQLMLYMTVMLRGSAYLLTGLPATSPSRALHGKRETMTSGTGIQT